MKIRKPEDVSKLPWAGNYRDDAGLFSLVSKYVRTQRNPSLRYEAERLCHWYGMGIKLPKKPRKVDLEFLEEQYLDYKADPSSFEEWG